MQTAQDILAQASNAQSAARLALGGGASATIWRNHRDEVRYPDLSGHTFSLYLGGGEGARRLDAGGAAGWTGAVCVMPEGHTSRWLVTSPLHFAHLHIPDGVLRAAFARIHDCDARLMAVDEAICVDAPDLAAPLRTLAGATAAAHPLRADMAIAELVAASRKRPVKLRGGLAPYIARRIDDWIDAHLDQTIRLRDLADLAGLSEFHLHRAFRLSRGIAPHAWVTRRRIAWAKAQLSTRAPIAEIAAASGFSNQSHLTRAFRKEVGLTPARYRQLCKA